MGGIREAYTALVSRYVVALDVWDGNPSVREAAATLGMGQQQYCDGYIARNFGPLLWTSGGSGIGVNDTIGFDAAYREAFILYSSPRC